jgi:hypothetical protein
MRTGRQIAKDRSMSSTNQPSVIISTPVTMALTGFRYQYQVTALFRSAGGEK